MNDEVLIVEGKKEIIIISNTEVLKITDLRGLCWGK